MSAFNSIAGRKVELEDTPFVIAEIGQAHEGSLGTAHAYIDALASTGVNAVKFQMHIADAESSIHEPFRVKFSLEDQTRMDYWRRMGFTLDQWKGLKEHCDAVGLEFLCSPFSNLSVDWLEEIGVGRYKIGSGEVNNFLILERIARTQKPVLLSSGMSSYAELDATVSFLRERNVRFSILQCTTAYPTMPEQYGLNMIGALCERYGVPVGYSDHSAKIETCIAATALGASVLEFHVAFDRRQFGPDSMSSLTLTETSQLVDAVRRIGKAMQHPIDKTNNDAFTELKQIFEKSLAINKDLALGHILTFEDLEAKKPKGYGIAASKFKEVIGKTLKFDKKKWDFLNPEDLI
ncbi:N-acetylneuraminate synthase family protein [Flavobacterium caeni]|uniref:N-acetylneuraminate synthase n=1 Tax=Flavobacterium caeni TaxID=490189 RepID=A0A1G5FKX4_9FLAO|nr:N-acetylneuraminate synthase family protein [Flavobacterium caeni]SCY39909.1 N-acetylneuraminate synthase [Flavobacterium caeni]